jgi:hypothetical protein
MIPASNANYVARYKQDNNGRSYFSLRPVVAWHDGGAQVVDGRTGRLVDADSFSNFANVQADETTPVVAAVPGGGWLAEYRGEGDATFTMPVVAWNVRADGTLDPICVGSDGISGDPTEDDNFVRLYLPSEEPSTDAPPSH